MQRAPDTDGYNFWLGQLNNGYPRASMISAFQSSGEFMQNVAAAFFGNEASHCASNKLGRYRKSSGITKMKSLLLLSVLLTIEDRESQTTRS